MMCGLCKSEKVIHIDNVILNNKPYRMYKCKDCGFIIRVPR